MADIMIDNWTLQRAAISINDTYEKISSPNEEYVKLIEALVLWDHVYFIDNEYSQYWKSFCIALVTKNICHPLQYLKRKISLFIV